MKKIIFILIILVCHFNCFAGDESITPEDQVFRAFDGSIVPGVYEGILIGVTDKNVDQKLYTLEGIDKTSNCITNTTGRNFYMNSEELIGFNITSETTFEVIYKQRSNRTYLCNPPIPVPDKVYKIIYGISTDGRIVKLKEVDGRHIPGKYIEESFEF